MTRHIPVLFEEVREWLHLEKGMTVVDATLGGGGHASMILESVSPTGRVIAFDADQEALDRFGKHVSSEISLKRAVQDGRLVLVQGNYSELAKHLDRLGVDRVDAILADLGFSSDQIESPLRGFSFQEDGPLDMRLDQTTALTARDIVNTYPEAQLVQILREYGDETESGWISRAIVKRRAEMPIETTRDLAEIVAEAYPRRKRALLKTNPATKTFQALRIAVNQEFEHLEKFLFQAIELLKAGGRLAVITFHSGEDKRVKQFFREAAQGCICPPNFPVCRCGQTPKVKIFTKKPIIPKEQELERNARARSAKLRVVEKV